MSGVDVTIRLKVVVRTTEPDVPVTVTAVVPAGVELLVVRVIVVVQVGVHPVGLKLALAPLGRPEAVKSTGVVVPVIKVAVTELVIELPLTTDLFPPFESEKSNAWLWVPPTGVFMSA